VKNDSRNFFFSFEIFILLKTLSQKCLRVLAIKAPPDWRVNGMWMDVSSHSTLSLWKYNMLLQRSPLEALFIPHKASRLYSLFADIWE
jgi:hypothetical protein